MDYLEEENIRYAGETENGQPHGRGIMKFPDGKTYKGFFKYGEFDGLGELTDETGEKLSGKWKNGQLISYSVSFSDGLGFSEVDWQYIVDADRRFYCEITKTVQPSASRIEPN